MKNILSFLLFSLLISSNYSFSQLRIVKDNIACTYGLKNEKGEWILQPTYILIEELNGGYFKTLTEEGKGIFTLKGTIIPNQFDDINIHNNYFQVRKNEKIGVYSLSGEMICPIEFTYYLIDGGRLMCYKKKGNFHTTTCYSNTGVIQINEIDGFIAPFLGKKYTFIGDYYRQENDMQGNVGLVNEKGEIIIPRKYDRMRICNDAISFSIGNKIGKISFNNQLILEQKNYLIPLGLAYNNELPCLDNDAVYQFYENLPTGQAGNKIGLIKGNGTIIHAATIDSIGKSYYENNNDKTAYIFKVNNKYGFLSKTGEITVEAIYDNISAKPRLNWENNYNKKKKVFFLVKQNNKLGLLSEDGKVQLKCEYDHFFRADYAKKPNYLISKADNVFYLDFEKDSLFTQDLTLLNSVKSIRLFSFKNDYFPFEIDHNKNLKTYLSTHVIGKFLFVGEGQKSVLYTLDGKLWNHYTNCFINYQNGKYALIHSKINTIGLLNLHTEKIILDTNFAEVNQAYAQKNLIWGKIQVGEEKVYYASQSGIYTVQLGEKKEYYMAPKYKWIPFDSLGNKLSNTKFDKITWSTDTSIVQDEGFYGVLDTKFNWLIKPSYQAILQFKKDQFVVFTKTHKYGLIDLRNKLILDTIYNDFETIFAGYYSNWKAHISQKRDKIEMESWILFKNEKEEILVNNFGEIIDSKSPKFQEKLIELAFLGSKNGDQSAYKITLNEKQYGFINPSLQSDSFKLFKTSIYEYFKLFHTQFKPCDFGKKSISLPINGNTCFPENRRLFNVQNLGHKFISVIITYPQEMIQRYEMMSQAHTYEFEFDNLIWKNQQLIEVSLDSIFGKGTLFETELIAAIQKRDDLKLDCSSIDNLVANFNKTFSISEKGIHLFYNQNSYNYEAVEVLIPIENLQKHTESAWIIEYL